jgi:hypothetical protein
VRANLVLTKLAFNTRFSIRFSGKIVFYTHPPEQHDLPAHLSAEIVQRWGSEFDVVSFFAFIYSLLE